MKDIFDTVIGFINALMQPLITVFALMVGGNLITTGKVSAEQAWLIPVGVIAYWFADKSGIWDKLFKQDPKADSLIETPNKVSGWGDCDYGDCADYDNETVSTGFSPAENKSTGVVEGIITKIQAELKADGILADVAAVSSRIVSYLGAHGDELDPDDLADLITAGINYASIAYKDVTGLTPPTNFDQVADYNKWWRNNQKACKAPKGEARAVLMTLRDLLKRRDDL